MTGTSPYRQHWTGRSTSAAAGGDVPDGTGQPPERTDDCQTAAERGCGGRKPVPVLSSCHSVLPYHYSSECLQTKTLSCATARLPERREGCRRSVNGRNHGLVGNCNRCVRRRTAPPLDLGLDPPEKKRDN